MLMTYYPIFILYTSRSTGLPKGVLYTHKMLFWNSVNTSLSLGINASSRTINFMPPFHTGGWNVLTTPFLHRGAYTCFRLLVSQHRHRRALPVLLGALFACSCKELRICHDYFTSFSFCLAKMSSYQCCSDVLFVYKAFEKFETLCTTWSW